MEKIRICFVETNCKKNGPIKQTLSIIQHLDKGIFEPILLTIWPEEHDNSMIDEYRESGIAIRSTNISRMTSIVFGKKKVSRILKEIKPDIIQGVGMPPYRMTLGHTDAIHLATLRNYCFEDYPDYYGKLVGMLMAYMDMSLIRRQIKSGESFVTCSKSLTMMYRERQGVEIPFIRNGVNVAQYTQRDITQQAVIRQRLGLPIEKYILTYSGSLIDRKNQRECIEGFLKSTASGDAVLLLLGDGADRDKLEQDYRKYENVIFAGKVSNVAECLHASDIYIATSKSEGLPNGVLEAMACGIPVLLSDIPQHLEVLEVDESCGYSYHLGSVEELAHKIDMIVAQDIVAMGNRAHKAVMDNFTAEGMSKRYQELYLRLMNKKSPISSIGGGSN